MGSLLTLLVVSESVMLFSSQSQRALVGFFLAVLLAVAASAVCVAFGASAIPSLAPGAAAVGVPSVPNARQADEPRAVHERGQATAATQEARPARSVGADS